MVIAAIGTVLAAGYLLWMFQKVAFGKVSAEFENSTSTTSTVRSGSRGSRSWPSSSFSASTRTSCSSHRPRGHAHRQRHVEGHLGESHRRLRHDRARIVLTGFISSCSWPISSGRSGRAWTSSRIASIGVLAALIPVITLAFDGARRELFGGAFVVDNYALALMGFFLVVAYISILLSADYIGEGDYYQGEFYFLLLTSVLGMVVMASARDLISIFVALKRSRSPRSSSPAGVSTTRTRTKRPSSTS